jgi:transposase
LHDGSADGRSKPTVYLFNLEERIPESHLLRRLNPVVLQVLADLREKLAPFYSEIGRPSIDPELMNRMLIVGYCYGIRFERRLCEDVELHLAYRWFCRLDLDDRVPDHSTFSVNRHGRFRDSDILRHVFEAVVRACMDAGLVKGDGFAAPPSQSQRTPNRCRSRTGAAVARMAISPRAATACHRPLRPHAGPGSRSRPTVNAHGAGSRPTLSACAAGVDPVGFDSVAF